MPMKLWQGQNSTSNSQFSQQLTSLKVLCVRLCAHVRACVCVCVWLTGCRPRSWSWLRRALAAPECCCWWCCCAESQFGFAGREEKPQIHFRAWPFNNAKDSCGTFWENFGWLWLCATYRILSIRRFTSGILGFRQKRLLSFIVTLHKTEEGTWI